MSAPAAPGWVTALDAAFRCGRPLALLFDYDGTLTPIVRHPRLAFLGERTRAALATLAGLPGVTVGVLSGRPLLELKERVGLPLPGYAGSGGLEVEVGGQVHSYPTPPPFPAAFDAAFDALRRVAGRFPGVWVERKPLAMALHFRELSAHAAARLRHDAAAVLAAFPAVRSREVSQAVEVGPADGWHKGTAAERVLEWARHVTGRDALAAYFGDAPNDEEGMAAVRAAGGLTVGVGPEPPAAEYGVADPAALTGWLTHLAHTLQDRTTGIRANAT